MTNKVQKTSKLASTLMVVFYNFVIFALVPIVLFFQGALICSIVQYLDTHPSFIDSFIVFLSKTGYYKQILLLGYAFNFSVILYTALALILMVVGVICRLNRRFPILCYLAVFVFALGVVAHQLDGFAGEKMVSFTKHLYLLEKRAVKACGYASRFVGSLVAYSQTLLRQLGRRITE